MYKLTHNEIGSKKNSLVQQVSAERKNSKRIDYTYKDYQDMENSQLILSYGPQVYEYSRYLEGLTYSLKDSDVVLINILEKHDITPQIRTKLVDWLFEVLYAYKCDEPTFYMTMHLFDAYLFKCQKKLTNSDIHLIGITCLYVSSKFEDYIPLDMNTVRNKIAHGKFSEKQIQNKEKQLLELMEFKIMGASTFDFIKNFIYDFIFNNKKIITKIKGKRNIEILEETAIYISKLILHSEIFSGFKSSIKAIACIVLSFNIVRENVEDFNGEIEKFTSDWIKFLVEQSRYEPDFIMQLYYKMEEYYKAFDSTPLIQNNLKKNVCLPF